MRPQLWKRISFWERVGEIEKEEKGKKFKSMIRTVHLLLYLKNEYDCRLYVVFILLERPSRDVQPYCMVLSLTLA